MLQTGDSKTFNIIDGQQRMTTLSLLVLAVLKNFKELIEAGEEPEPNQRRLEQLRGTYLGYVDPVTLVSRSKLTLNRNNDLFYQNYLVPLQRVPQRGLKSSEHALRKGSEWFVEKLRQHYRGRRTGAALAEFIDRLADTAKRFHETHAPTSTRTSKVAGEPPRLCLVRETKGTTVFARLEQAEREKIACGQRHFKALGFAPESYDWTDSAAKI